MSTWCFYSTDVFAGYTPKLLITDVPEGETVTDDVVARAGYTTTGGLPESTHVIELSVTDSPADLVGSIRRGNVPRITYAELMKRANAPL